MYKNACGIVRSTPTLIEPSQAVNQGRLINYPCSTEVRSRVLTCLLCTTQLCHFTYAAAMIPAIQNNIADRTVCVFKSDYASTSAERESSVSQG